MKGDVLIVDDDPDFCEIARTALEAASFAVRCATDGSQGMCMMRERKPDLVLLDVIMRMPDEGVYVSQEMEVDPELWDIPVVMVSSIMDSEYIGNFPTDGTLHIDQFLTKPVALDKLVSVANQYTSGKQSP